MPGLKEKENHVYGNPIFDFIVTKKELKKLSCRSCLRSFEQLKKKGLLGYIYICEKCKATFCSGCKKFVKCNCILFTPDGSNTHIKADVVEV